MTWSYSRITSFEDCPYKWFLTYLYPGIAKQSSFFAEYGSYMHLILQMHLSGILPKNSLSAFYVSHFKDNVRAKAPNQKIYNTYFEQGFLYFDSFCFPDRKILSVEERVNFYFANKPFTGFIDVVSDDGQLIITDHKSRALKPRSNRSKPTKLDAELDVYLRQLYVYSAAVKEKYNKFPDALELNCFRTQTMIREPFNLGKYYGVEEWANRQISLITENDNWNAKPDYWRCNYLCDVCRECEYKGLV